MGFDHRARGPLSGAGMAARVSTVALGGASTRLLEYGSEEGIPVIGLHSAGLDAFEFDAFAQRLVQLGNFRFLAFDQRGHGVNTAQSTDISLESMGQDVLALIERLRLSTAHIIGHSIGGAVAARTCAQASQTIRSLTVASTPLTGLPVFVERAKEARTRGLSRIVEDTIPRWFNPDDDEDHPEAIQYAAACLRRMSVTDWAAIWDSFAGFQGFADIAPPSRTVCVVGQLDRSTPPHIVMEIGSVIKAGSTHVVPGAPHQLFLTHPEVLATIWAEWALGRD